MKNKALAWAPFVPLFFLAGCSSYSPWFAASGPSSSEIAEPQQKNSTIPIVDVTDEVAHRVSAAQKRATFSEVLGEQVAPGYMIGAGDVLEVSIWEAPPATLFGNLVLDPRAGSATTRVVSLPEQMVAVDGTINVPFAGGVKAAGKAPHEVEVEIARRLSGKANQPQVLVRVTRNATANVTVVGEVAQSLRMPLTAKGERLLDAIAAAGGVRQPVGKMTIQLSRAGKVLTMPLDIVIQNPRQNVVLFPGDVVTALFQPLSFTALGAAGRNEEINFEAQGISLAQAFGRIGGLQDTRADARGIFIFRFEDQEAFPGDGKAMPRTPEGKVPVVYRVDLKDPRSFLVAQDFPLRNKDVLYVTNAPSAELQKFLNILTSTIYSVSGLANIRP